jgi:hypothetical protein
VIGYDRLSLSAEIGCCRCQTICNHACSVWHSKVILWHIRVVRVDEYREFVIFVSMTESSRNYRFNSKEFKVDHTRQLLSPSLSTLTLYTMLSRTPRSISRISSRQLSSLTARPACLALPRHVLVAPTPLHCRGKSTIVQRSPLHSVPSKAEAVGKPAVDTKKGKVWESAEEAVKDIKSGSLVLSSGQSYSSNLERSV